MLGQDKVRELLQQVLSFSKADQTEVIFEGTDSALTRFANSAIHQNVAETNTEIRVRLVYGKKVGVASCNDLSPESLKRTVETARAIAMRQRENPDFKSLPSAQPIQNVESFVEATANFTPEQRAQVVSVICKRSKEKGLAAAGAFTTTTFETAVANSLGVFAYHPGTYADLNAVMMSDTGSGYASFTHQDARKINAEAIAKEALDKAQRARHPIAVEPGEYTVLLEEYAVTDLLDFLNYIAFSALAVQEERSFIKGKIGQKVMHDSVTIWDDGCAPDGIAMPFDFEGTPRQKVVFVENGIARAVMYDTATAQRDNVASTGHSLPAPNSYGPFAMHMAMAPGNTPKSEIIKGVERGIWVTRFWYTRVVHPMKVLITGMTRDGTFLIENGEITKPIRNLRFTTSYLDALNHVRAIGNTTQLFFDDWSHTSRRVPAILVDGFKFTGVTEF
ncbi:MAG: TldD/PmbA family protein [Chloroflexi bacterium]|nr:TldD/PmbA family protein [Chloroflexota bacterium]